MRAHQRFDILEPEARFPHDPAVLNDRRREAGNSRLLAERLGVALEQCDRKAALRLSRGTAGGKRQQHDDDSPDGVHGP
jgi:hypothetical protein